MRQPEQKTKKGIREIFRELGVWYCTPMATRWSQPGVPYFLACMNGEFLAVEAKSDQGRLTPMQVRQLQKIAEQGGAALVVKTRHLPELRALLTEARRSGMSVAALLRQDRYEMLRPPPATSRQRA